jgi:hypothetical protein
MKAKEALAYALARPERLKATAIENCRAAVSLAALAGQTLASVDIAEKEARKAATEALQVDGYKIKDTGNGLIIDWSKA